MRLSRSLLLLTTSSVASNALAISQPSTSDPQPFGIGFSLSIDYAVASIYHPDGSTIDILKTDGSPKYQTLMKRAGRDSLTLSPPSDPTTHSRLVTQLQTQPQTESSSSSDATQVPLQDRLSHWFDVSDPNQGLIDMFHTLKVAVEAYVERPIETVDVAVPFPLSAGLETGLQAAYRATGLRAARPAQQAGVLATKYEGLTGTCSDEVGHQDSPAQLIISVDYSRAALTLTLLEEECSVVAWRRVEHDERLGDKAMRACKAQYGEEKCDKETKAFIHRALLPLGDESAPEYVSTMLLAGEYSMSTKIMWLVKEELGRQLPASVASDPANRFRQHVQPVDPVFAAARAAAWEGWRSMMRARKAEAQFAESNAVEL